MQFGWPRRQGGKLRLAKSIGAAKLECWTQDLEKKFHGDALTYTYDFLCSPQVFGFRTAKLVANEHAAATPLRRKTPYPMKIDCTDGRKGLCGGVYRMDENDKPMQKLSGIL